MEETGGEGGGWKANGRDYGSIDVNYIELQYFIYIYTYTTEL